VKGVYVKMMNFASGQGRSKRVIIVLWILVVLDILAIFTARAQLGLISKYNAGERVLQEQSLSADRNQHNVAVLIFVGYILSVIFFLMWIHRAHRNLPALKAENLKDFVILYATYPGINFQGIFLRF